jgi:WD40 repeat protein
VVHHNKPFLATASDDGTWSIWALPKGEKIMTGEGHSDWISDVSFHP